MWLTLNDGTTLECADQPFAEGGEGRLFLTTAGDHVAKLYKAPTPDREVALRKIISPEYNVVAGEPYWAELLAWPAAIVRQPTLGVLLPRVPADRLELRWFLGPKPRAVLAAKYGPAKLGHWGQQLAVAIKLARIARRLHFRGLCHADFSFRNFLVDVPLGQASLIDCDSLVVPGFLPTQVLGTPLCMAPELMRRLTATGPAVDPSPQTDLHALATLIYWLLFQRHPLLGPQIHDPDPALDEALALGEKALFIEHPTDKRNTPANLPYPYPALLPPAAQTLFENALVHGLHQPARRPSAADWDRFLSRTADTLVPCANPTCAGQMFVLHTGRPAICPFCQTPLTGVATIPILHFYNPRRGRAGHFQNDRGYYLAGWPGRTLHLWHTDPTCSPGPAVSTVPQAILEYEAGRAGWFLRNLALTEAHLLDPQAGSTPLPLQQPVPLTTGARLLLGPPEQSRLIYVQLLPLP